jgi:hypothetical protein
MIEPVFSGTAQIHIQGSQVLKFVSLNANQVSFDIVGMSKPKIRVIDCRPDIRLKMKELLETKEVSQLTSLINKPARITITKKKNRDKDVVVRLDKTRAKNPRHMLWVATGISGEIPYYDYKNLEIQSSKKKSFALFSLYKRPIQKK